MLHSNEQEGSLIKWLWEIICLSDYSEMGNTKWCQKWDSSIFAESGLAKTIHCDRGTNYTSVKFQEFCKSLNIKVTYSSTEHYSSNYAERCVQTVKQFMRKTEEWQMVLLEYLMTPIRLQGIHSSPFTVNEEKGQLEVSYQLDNKLHAQSTMKGNSLGN